MSGTQTAALVAGAAFELLGVVLIAAPDLVPGAKRLGRWLRVRWRTVENHVRRVLGRPPRPIIAWMSANLHGGSHVGAKATVSFREDAPLEDKVEYLLRRDQAVQDFENRITERFQALEKESQRSVEALRRDIQALIEKELRVAQEDYRAVRIVGTIALLVGLALTTAANFV